MDTQLVKDLVLEAESAKQQMAIMQSMVIALMEQIGQDKITISNAVLKASQSIESVEFKQVKTGLVIRVNRKAENG